MRPRHAVAAVAAAVLATGSGVAAHASTAHAAHSAGPSCTMQTIMFEDGSWEGGEVDVRNSHGRMIKYADEWQIAPTIHRITYPLSANDADTWSGVIYYTPWLPGVGGHPCKLTVVQ